MTDRPELPKIEVAAEVAAAAGMPGDLDANALGPYEVPDPARRRRVAVVYFVGTVIVVVGIAVGLPSGMWVMAAILLAIGAYHLAAGHHLVVKDREALTTANRSADFPVGHASAVLSFDGVMARPVWNVLVFSADEPPSRRGLIRIDGRSGEVVETYVEEIELP
jgi:hypothetical protein